jgi:hypothetical protein
MTKEVITVKVMNTCQGATSEKVGYKEGKIECHG